MPCRPIRAVVQQLETFVGALGKSPVVVKDRPGFLINHLLMPYLNDVDRRSTTTTSPAPRTSIRRVELGLGYKMGPLELLDLIGLDAHHHATSSAYEATLDPRFAPPPLLQPDGRRRLPRYQDRQRISDRQGAQSMTTYTDIIVKQDGPVLTITINRPDAGNKLRHQTCLELFDALRQLRLDPSLRASVLTGNGRQILLHRRRARRNHLT